MSSDSIRCHVVRVVPYGLFLRLPDLRTGLLHVSEMSDELSSIFRSKVQVGDVVLINQVLQTPKGWALSNKKIKGALITIYTEETLNALKDTCDVYALQKERVEVNLKALEQSLKEKKIERETLTLELQELAKRRDACAVELNELRAEATLYQGQVNAHHTAPPKEVHKLPSALRSLLWHSPKTRLRFDERILRELLASLASAQLTVLSGPSGTGKSAICRSFASLFGARVEVCPVQSNWVSNAQLLGYHNPLAQTEETWVNTPLYEFLGGRAGASDHEGEELPQGGGLSLAVLDEMNLAYVEHYLAELLSKLAESERPLKLPLTGDPHKGHLLIKRDFRLVGTVNIDETTHQLSPKVVDRSCVLTFHNPLLSEEEQLPPSPQDALWLTAREEGTPQLGWWLTSPLEEHTERDERAAILLSKLDTLNRELLRRLGPDVPYSFRTQSLIQELLRRLIWLGATDDEALDSAACLKILPRLRFFDASEQVREAMLTLTSQLKEQGAHHASKLCAQITQRAQENRGAYDFWRYSS